MLSHASTACSKAAPTLPTLCFLDKTSLAGDEERAKYALLMSMALDKNCIDTTEFDVLQPAIDYYLSNGTPDEKLRTLYYQGIVYHNRNDFSNAMQSFLSAERFKCEMTDTLTFANMLSLQGTLFHRSYQLDNYVKYNIDAGDLYEKIGHEKYRQDALARALDGFVGLNDKTKADSIMSLLQSHKVSNAESKKVMGLSVMTYALKFGHDSILRQMADTLSSISRMDDEQRLNYSSFASSLSGL